MRPSPIDVGISLGYHDNLSLCSYVIVRTLWMVLKNWLASEGALSIQVFSG